MTITVLIQRRKSAAQANAPPLGAREDSPEALDRFIRIIWNTNSYQSCVGAASHRIDSSWVDETVHHILLFGEPMDCFWSVWGMGMGL
jgi:hypothetical protein